MRSGWLPGDLGRSRLDPNDCPRFEAIRATKDGVVIWYHLETRFQIVPVRTFRRDYVNTWVIAKAIPPTIVAPGLIFSIKSATAPDSTLSLWLLDKHLAPSLLMSPQTLQCIQGRDLKVRQVKQNYSSCEVLGKSTLVLLPSIHLEQYGTLRVTLWDHLDTGLDF